VSSWAVWGTQIWLPYYSSSARKLTISNPTADSSFTLHRSCCCAIFNCFTRTLAGTVHSLNIILPRKLRAKVCTVRPGEAVQFTDKLNIHVMLRALERSTNDPMEILYASKRAVRDGVSSRRTTQPLIAKTTVIHAMRKEVNPTVTVNTRIAFNSWASIAVTVSVLCCQD